MDMQFLMVMNLNWDINRTLTPVGWRWMEKDLGYGKLLAKTSQLWSLAFSQTRRPGSFSDKNDCELGYWRNYF